MDAASGLSPTLRAMNSHASHANAGGQVAIAFDTTQITSAANGSNPQPGDTGHPVTAQGHPPAIAFSVRGRDGEAQIEPEAGSVAPAVRTATGGSSKSFVAASADAVRWAVRRLIPTECEALQGVERNFTRIPWRGAAAEDCPDGPRYKVIGNSMAVDVMAWIGRQIILAETPHAR